MILVDFSQITISNVMSQIGNVVGGVDIQEDMLRHMVLNSLRHTRSQFFSQYGELVICCDSRQYWRKDVFPYYKSNRKASRAKSPLDWNKIFESISNIRGELATHMPYPVVWLDKAEADDIIAVLARSAESPTLIVSGDEDFVQLQRNPWVKQWAPIAKKWIVPAGKIDDVLIEHIVRGDSSDGIPNILSDDDTIVTVGKRQKKIMETYLQTWYGTDPAAPDLTTRSDVERQNFTRNSTLIDLRNIPLPVASAIMIEAKAAYAAAQERGRHNIFTYFMTHRLKTLTEKINDF